MTKYGIIDFIVFSVIQNMSMHTKIIFLWQLFKSCSILGYCNTQPVAMAAIVDKKFPLRGFLGTLCEGVKWAFK